MLKTDFERALLRLKSESLLLKPDQETKASKSLISYLENPTEFPVQDLLSQQIPDNTATLALYKTLVYIVHHQTQQIAKYREQFEEQKKAVDQYKEQTERFMREYDEYQRPKNPLTQSRTSVILDNPSPIRGHSNTVLTLSPELSIFHQSQQQKDFQAQYLHAQLEVDRLKPFSQRAKDTEIKLREIKKDADEKLKQIVQLQNEISRLKNDEAQAKQEIHRLKTDGNQSKQMKQEIDQYIAEIQMLKKKIAQIDAIALKSAKFSIDRPLPEQFAELQARERAVIAAEKKIATGDPEKRKQFILAQLMANVEFMKAKKATELFEQDQETIQRLKDEILQLKRQLAQFEQ